MRALKMDMNKGYFISIENVSMRFGDVEAVRDVTLSVEEGTICGLVGSDGAGKSTLLRMVATMIPPVSGKIMIDNHDAVEINIGLNLLSGICPSVSGSITI